MDRRYFTYPVKEATQARALAFPSLRQKVACPSYNLVNYGKVHICTLNYHTVQLQYTPFTFCRSEGGWSQIINHQPPPSTIISFFPPPLRSLLTPGSPSCLSVLCSRLPLGLTHLETLTLHLIRITSPSLTVSTPLPPWPQRQAAVRRPPVAPSLRKPW